MKTKIDIFSMIANIARPEPQEPDTHPKKCVWCDHYSVEGLETTEGYFCDETCQKDSNKFFKEHDEDNFYLEDFYENQND